MTDLLLVLTGVVLIAIAVMYFVTFRNKPKRPVDYFTFFIIGIAWTGAGVPLLINTKNPGILAMGIIFMVVGLANKSKWKENRKRFSKLDEHEKKFKLFIIAALLVLVILGIAVNLLQR